LAPTGAGFAFVVAVVVAVAFAVAFAVVVAVVVAVAFAVVVAVAFAVAFAVALAVAFTLVVAVAFAVAFAVAGAVPVVRTTVKPDPAVAGLATPMTAPSESRRKAADCDGTIPMLTALDARLAGELEASTERSRASWTSVS
jgi:hypothetical protein